MWWFKTDIRGRPHTQKNHKIIPGYQLNRAPIQKP